MIAHLRCLRTLPALRDFAGLVRRASIAARAKTRRYRSAISPVLTSAVAVVNQHACASQRALHHQLLSAA